MENYLDSANKVLDSVVMKQIPAKILKDCKGVALVNAVEFAFFVSGGGGGGVLVKHNEDGSWGAPSAINIDFAGLGANIGATNNKYIVLVPTTEDALKKLTVADIMPLGAEIGLAVGPGVEAAVGLAAARPIYSYTFEKGIMVKAGLTGAEVTHNTKANGTFYGVEKTPAEIVMEPGAVTLPEGNTHLDEFYKKLGSL